MDGDKVAKKHSARSWMIAFFRERVQTGLFFWYIVGSLLAVFVLPGEHASALIAVFVVGLLMAIVIVSRLHRRLRTKNEDDGRKESPGTTQTGPDHSAGWLIRKPQVTRAEETNVHIPGSCISDDGCAPGRLRNRRRSSS